MINESKALTVTALVTDVRAYFFKGTMFLETEDSTIASRVFRALKAVFPDSDIVFGEAGQSETSYDFV